MTGITAIIAALSGEEAIRVLAGTADYQDRLPGPAQLRALEVGLREAAATGTGLSAMPSPAPPPMPGTWPGPPYCTWPPPAPIWFPSSPGPSTTPATPLSCSSGLGQHQSFAHGSDRLLPAW